MDFSIIANQAERQFSPRLDIDYQVTVAAYVQDTVQIDLNLYSRLSANEQCGTQVHEAVRVYGDLVRARPYSAAEVEAFTQDIMGIAVQDGAALASALL